MGSLPSKPAFLVAPFESIRFAARAPFSDVYFQSGGVKRSGSTISARLFRYARSTEDDGGTNSYFIRGQTTNACPVIDASNYD
jgi:hypothetical protein